MHAFHLASRIIVVSFAVVVVAACGSNPVIGVLLPTTGDASSYGESMKEAIDLAVEEAKAGGSYPANLTIVWGDSASDPATGRSEIRRLAGEGAELIIAGTTSGTAKAFLPELDDSDVIVLSPSASAPSLTKDSKRFFRLFASDELEGQRAGRFLFEDQNKSTVLIFSQDSEQARGIEPFFRQVYEGALGGTVVGRVLIGDPNWREESADLLASRQPESVYIIAYANPTLEVLRFLKEKAYTGTICATSAFYSGVNERRFRFLDMWTSKGIVARNQVSTKQRSRRTRPSGRGCSRAWSATNRSRRAPAPGPPSQRHTPRRKAGSPRGRHNLRPPWSAPRCRAEGPLCCPATRMTATCRRC